MPLGALLPQVKKYKPFLEVKDEIRKTLVHAGATQMAYELIRGDVAEIGRLQKPSLGIWADGKRVRWVTLPGFRTEEQLKETDVGQAVHLESQGPEPETLASDALSIKELKVENPKLAVGEVSEPYLGKDGQVFAFRVTAVLPNHPPESLAEVRDAVLANVKGIKAMDLARQKARALLEEAEKKGLEAAAKDLERQGGRECLVRAAGHHSGAVRRPALDAAAGPARDRVQCDGGRRVFPHGGRDEEVLAGDAGRPAAVAGHRIGRPQAAAAGGF